MPSTSKKQHNFMEAIAHNPSFAKKVGIKQSVGQDFATADKSKKFKGGGMAKSDMKEDTKMDKAQDKAMIKKAFGMHDKQEHKGEKTDLSKLKKGGMAGKHVMPGGKVMKDSAMGKMAKGKGYAAGGMPMVEKDGKKVPSFAADGVGKMAKGGMAKMSKGGCSKMAKGGGIEVRGKTKGKVC